jgi:dTDP-4-dehydrorhamnose 3,5-epimerase
MQFIPTHLPGAYVVCLEPLGDDRGHFARTFCREEFAAQGLNVRVEQANTAYSAHKGTLRGMHYQAEPKAEAKLVRCIRGRLFDVMVDLRPESATYCQWFGRELTPGGKEMLYVPEGFVHGYQTLEADTEVVYQVSAAYAHEAERGGRWNDPAFSIDWPLTKGLTLSSKDRAWPDFQA